MQEQDNNKLHDTAALRALSEEEIAESPADKGESYEAKAVDLGSHESARIDVPIVTAAKRATQAKFSNKRTQTIGLQFRKIAIPALLGVGVILWVIGGLTIWMKNNTPPEAVKQNPLLMNAELFMWICIIMGLALTGGAIFFLVELKKSQQQG